MRFTDKIFITVRIPALGGVYNFAVPQNMLVEDAKKLMIRILSSEYGISDNIEDVNLFDTKDGKMLDVHNSFLIQCITSGTELMLV